MGDVINGRIIADKILLIIASGVRDLIQNHSIKPTLAAVVVGSNSASHLYLRRKQQACHLVGISSHLYTLPALASESKIKSLIAELNKDPKIHGILVQLPLPDHINQRTIASTVNPTKDVDGLHSVNIGRLIISEEAFIPCTPHGCKLMLESYLGNLSGKNVTIVGRSILVGRSLAHLLTNMDCTVTLAHSKTTDLPNVCRQSEILIVAIGRPKFITSSFVTSASVVIDVGINVLDSGRICGDVNFENIKNFVKAVSPVPGGVGPMTIACLMSNTLKAACINNRITLTMYNKALMTANSKHKIQLF